MKSSASLSLSEEYDRAKLERGVSVALLEPRLLSGERGVSSFRDGSLSSASLEEDLGSPLSGLEAATQAPIQPS